MDSFSSDCFSKQWIQYIMIATKENGLGENHRKLKKCLMGF